MKKNYLFIFLIISSLSIAQSGAPASPYYNGFNFNQTGAALKNALSNLTIAKHTNFLSYTPEVWNATKITDLDPNNSNNVLLIYGYENGLDGDITNDLFRDKNTNGGNNGDWNREHVYAKALGTPNLVDGGSGADSDAGEDAHHLRSADVQRNSARGSLKFAPGSGNSSTVIGGWYPGDQWKGDVARMMMYMYLRYGNQCLPNNVGTGATVVSDPNMISLFLQWNAEDPVSQFEDNRNTHHNSNSSTAQGNRNPFIDNPYLATVIWGGAPAQNRWPSVYLSNSVFDLIANVTIYPNPSNDHKINIETKIVLDEIELINLNGQLIQIIKKPTSNNDTYSLENLPEGFYFLRITSENQTVIKKIIIN